MVSARDEAVRSNEDMRVKLSKFENTLRGVSEEALIALEKKEAVLRRVEEERKEERESRGRGADSSSDLCRSERVCPRGRGAGDYI